MATKISELTSLSSFDNNDLLLVVDSSENLSKKTTIGFITQDKAPINSPTLTGTPRVPNASNGDDSTQIANTSFVQNEIATNLGNLKPLPRYSGNVSLTEDEFGGIVQHDGVVDGETIYLPTALNNNGKTYTIHNQSEQFKYIEAPATNVFLDGNSNASNTRVLRKGMTETFVSNNVNWVVVSSEGNSKVNSTGYTTLRNGVLMQWTKVTVPAGSTSTIIFPIPFMVACYGVTATKNSTSTVGSNWGYDTVVHSIKNTSCVVTNADGTAIDIFIQALGY